VAKNIKGMADYSEPFVCFFKFTFWAWTRIPLQYAKYKHLWTEDTGYPRSPEYC
jgi:hypothetical protein